MRLCMSRFRIVKWHNSGETFCLIYFFGDEPSLGSSPFVITPKSRSWKLGKKFVVS
jgi:hypothetical protein